MRAFYCGTRHHQAGHFVYESPAKHTKRRDSLHIGGMPWAHLDSRSSYPSETEGEALLRQRDGWTSLGFANNMDDNRPGSHSTFAFNETLTFEEALAAAKEHFPDVFEQITFPIQLVKVSS